MFTGVYICQVSILQSKIFLIKIQADAENAEDEIREAFQVFDGVSLRLNSQQFFGQSSMRFIRMAMDS